MDLPQLFASRKAWAGSTRAMAARAEAAGYPISHAQLGFYARPGQTWPFPSERTRRGIAAALFGEPEGRSFDEVTAAAMRSVAPEALAGFSSQHAIAFLRLTEGRTDEEIRQTLGVVEATLRAMAASREAVESNSAGEDT